MKKIMEDGRGRGEVGIGDQRGRQCRCRRRCMNGGGNVAQ